MHLYVSVTVVYLKLGQMVGCDVPVLTESICASILVLVFFDSTPQLLEVVHGSIVVAAVAGFVQAVSPTAVHQLLFREEKLLSCSTAEGSRHMQPRLSLSVHELLHENIQASFQNCQNSCNCGLEKPN